MRLFRFAIIFTICFFLCACTRTSRLYDVAVKQLPITLGQAMAEYMETVGEPAISDLQVIFDCDSLCILQCKASALDASGRRREETVRYFFVRDNIMSAVSGSPQYFDSVTGAKYLDKKGIKDFVKKYKESSTEHYTNYLGMSVPIESL